MVTTIPFQDEIKSWDRNRAETEVRSRLDRIQAIRDENGGMLATLIDQDKKDEVQRLHAELTALGSRLDDVAEMEAAEGQIARWQNRLYVPANAMVHPVGKKPGIPVTEDPTGGFQSFGHFIQAAYSRPNDSRIRILAEMSMGVGAEGGILVPEQFRAGLLELSPSEAVFRPRAMVIPAGDPPDGSLTIPVLDQSGARGVYGGVVVSWIAEGELKPETDFKFADITLTPKEVAGHIVLTDKLLRNAAEVGPLAQRLLRGAIVAAEEEAFLLGSGIGTPLGLIGHPATIEVTRTTAGQIEAVDLINMYAVRRVNSGPYVWIANQTVLPQLMTMNEVGTGTGNVWQPSMREGEPGTLIGIPLIFNEYSPPLGSPGDLILANLSFYIIKNGSGPFVEFGHYDDLWVRNKIAVKITWNVDGQPWLTGPVTLQDGVTQVSPFVALE